mgnify:CR=1 FL=1
MDPNILVGLTMRSNIFAFEYGGKKRYASQWKHLLATLLDRMTFWILTTCVWRFLGVTLLLPFKEDILAGRYDDAP